LKPFLEDFFIFFPLQAAFSGALPLDPPDPRSSQIITAAEQTTFGVLDVVHRWGRRCQLLKEHQQMGMSQNLGTLVNPK